MEVIVEDHGIPVAKDNICIDASVSLIAEIQKCIRRNAVKRRVGPWEISIKIGEERHGFKPNWKETNVHSDTQDH